jgi:hypothetical protein
VLQGMPNEKNAHVKCQMSWIMEGGGKKRKRRMRRRSTSSAVVVFVFVV